jgi:hypothetical protein
LLLSSGAIATLVYTFIEAPGRGWGSVGSIAGYVAAAVLAAAFVIVERHAVARGRQPMLDVTLFRTPAFSAASGSVTVAFFALFGFIFLITQYFQFVRGYGTLSTGARILPVAMSIALGSVVGAILAGRIGTRTVVVGGLLMFGSAFGWIAVSPTFMPYSEIVAQMVLMGLGLGLTTAPATESILSVLPAAKAGVGSAVNDATREAGGTLGVAIIGSVFTSLYARHLATTDFSRLPHGATEAARQSVAAAYAIAGRNGGALVESANRAFMTGLHAGCVVAAAVCWLGAVGALALPGRRRRTTPVIEDGTVVPAAA